MLCRVFVLYARVLTAHSLRRNCPKLRRSEWTSGYPRVNSATKGRAQTFISHTIRSILQVLIFGIALNTHPSRAPVKQS